MKKFQMVKIIFKDGSRETSQCCPVDYSREGNIVTIYARTEPLPMPLIVSLAEPERPVDIMSETKKMLR